MVEFVEIASVIQMAVAPAFLLTGVGAILTVMTARLTRIVDRFRVLHENSKDLKGYKQEELNFLIRRAKWTHWAIALTTISALLICVLIAMIFIATEISFDFNQLASISNKLNINKYIVNNLIELKKIEISTETYCKI